MKLHLILFFLLVNSIFFPDRIFAQNEVIYSESDAVIANPERGLYKYTITDNNYYTSTGYTNLDQNTLNEWRNGPDKITIIYRIFSLDQFLNSDISVRYLENIQLDLNEIRNAGFTCIVRFAYSQTMSAQPQQPSRSRILRHIQQVSSILTANKDVILAYQAGFIGTWGEWYYTNSTEFGTEGTINTTQWKNRKEIVDSMLASTPANMFVLLRYPSLKQNMYGSVQLNDLTAYQNTANARIGFFNDAFLNNWGDMGTYSVDSELENPVGSTDYTYLSNETKYTPMVGETNGINAPRTNGSNALVELELTNWSTLNRDYYTQVFTNWINSGNYSEIVKRLGYRIHLINSIFSNADNNLNIHIKLKNTGFARPFKDRTIKLLLKNTSTNNYYPFLINTDFRTWADTVNIIETIDLSEIPFGNYAAYLQLADINSSLSENPKYAVRLANDNVWLDSLGINDLLRSFTYSATIIKYTFIGTGNWTLGSNWSNGQKPPAVLPANSEIIIDPVINTECILNTPQTILTGAKITVATGKQFLIQGNLTIKQE